MYIVVHEACNIADRGYSYLMSTCNKDNDLCALFYLPNIKCFVVLNIVLNIQIIAES